MDYNLASCSWEWIIGFKDMKGEGEEVIDWTSTKIDQKETLSFVCNDVKQLF